MLFNIKSYISIKLDELSADQDVRQDMVKVELNMRIDSGSDAL